MGMFAYALLSVRAQNIKMFTTYDDWNNWNNTNAPMTFQATNALDLDGVTVNGIGNTNAGATSIGGALQVSPIVYSNWGTNGAGQYVGPVWAVTGASGAILAALDGPNAAYGSPLPPQTGTMYVDYTLPDHDTNGTFFALGIFIQYGSTNEGVWGAGGQDYSPTDLGPVSTPSGTQEKYRATIPYAITGTTNDSTYFSLGFWIFTDYVGTNNWYIDNVSVAPLPVTIIPAAVQPLFDTYDDFNTGWTASGGDLIQADNAWSMGGSTTNGLGNTNAPGATDGTSGSLLIYWSSLETGFGVIASSPDEENNASFMQAIDPGCNPGSQTSATAYGNLYVTYSQPDAGGGNYFQLGVQLAYNAATIQYGWLTEVFYPSSTKDLGYQDNNGYEVYQATIPYHINAGSYAGNFALNFFINSNYQPTNGFHIGDISVSSAAQPVLSAGMDGGNMVIQGTNGLTGRKYSLLTTTNLALPGTNWTVMSVGVPFNGPTFTATNNAASPSSFYKIKVQ